MPKRPEWPHAQDPLIALANLTTDPLCRLEEPDEAAEADVTEAVFYGPDLVGDSPSGIRLGDEVAFFGGPDLGPTPERAETFDAELSSADYEWELHHVDGERWAARQDPWDGP
jgi:hypothetical protein